MSNDKTFNPARKAFKKPSKVILAGTTLLWVFAYLLANPDRAPEHIQLIGQVIGPDFSEKFMRNLFYLHAGEAVLALLICLKRGYYSTSTTIKWVLSILFIGIPQTKHLIFKTEE